MPINRNRPFYLFMIIATIVIGLASRSNFRFFHGYIHDYLGDILYAFMIYLIVGLVFRQTSSIKVALISIVICYSIELSQLYHAEWINEIRKTRLGGLILGFGFLWSDLISYFVGVLLGTGFEQLIHKKMKTT